MMIIDSKTPYVHVDSVQIGDHLTRCGYSDRESFTVIKKTRRTVLVQRDAQEIDHDKWTPDIVLGGFVGHCTNQSSQVWTVSPDPAGFTATWRAGRDGILKTPGATRPDVIAGSHPFHDFNF